jgi:hypothetical protein
VISVLDAGESATHETGNTGFDRRTTGGWVNVMRRTVWVHGIPKTTRRGRPKCTL